MDHEPELTREVDLRFPVDLKATLRGVWRGTRDPSWRFRPDGIWRASRSPTGPATIRLVDRGRFVEVGAWGPGAQAALDGAANLVGANDDDHGFAPEHPIVARLWRDHRDVRMPRSSAVTESLLACVLEQRVTTFEARRSMSQMATRWGEPAPGPIDLTLPMDPEVLAGVPHYELHVLGIERKRADTMRRVAANARRLDALATLPVAEARLRLVEVPGIGEWTAAEVALVALGDADAVPIGDAHLPNDVTHVLSGRAVDDDAMLEALEPFAGHRGRVIRLLAAAGLRAPRRAPRYAPRDISDQ